MPRRLRNKELQENSDSESGGDDDEYQQEEERDESGSPTPSQSPSLGLSPTPSPSPSPSLAPPSPSPRSETPFPKRVTRSFTFKANKAAATPKTPKTPKIPMNPKTPSIPRTIITRAKVNKKQAAAQDQSEVDTESVDDPDPGLPNTPTAKNPRPRTKRSTGGKAQSGREVESERDVKPVKTPAPKKPGAKPKGHGAGGHLEEDVESEADIKPPKTHTPNRPRAKSEGPGAAGGRAKSPVTPKKPSAPRPKKPSKMSVSAATTPLFASFQGCDVDDDGSPIGLPTKVWSPLDSPMDGIESAAMLLTTNRDCEKMPIAIPQPERNCRGGYPCRGTYDVLSRCPTVLPETPMPDKSGQDTARATDMRSIFSPFIKKELRTLALFAPAVPLGQRQTGSSVPDDKHMFSLPVKAESHVPEPLGSAPISATDTTQLIGSQTPSSLMTLPRPAGLKLDLCTVQPWQRATVLTPMSSMPSFLARINYTSSATTTPYTAALAPPETIDDVAKAVDKTYDEASQYLFGAMNLTKRALEDQAHAIRFHTVAFEVFGQGMTMTEPQCQILFPQEHFAFMVASALLAPTPLQAPLASAVTPISVMLAPQAQTVTNTQGESLLINVVKNMKQTPVGPSGYESASTRSSSYSSYLSSSRALSSTPPSPPSTPPRSPMTAPIPIRRHFGEWGTVVPWLSSSDFANHSVQPSIFAHNRQGDATTTPPPPPPLRSSSSSAQTSETLVSPCIATSFAAIMSAANQHYSLHALKKARRKALYEHFQSQRDEKAIQSGAQDQQRDSIPSQQQEGPLATSTFVTPRVQQEDYYGKQDNQEMDRGYLRATTEKGKETRAKEAGPMRIQITLSQWGRIKELSTELYLRAVKSYENSRDADRVASESHDRFMDASKRWYAVTGQHFPYD